MIRRCRSPIDHARWFCARPLSRRTRFRPIAGLPGAPRATARLPDVSGGLRASYRYAHRCPRLWTKIAKDQHVGGRGCGRYDGSVSSKSVAPNSAIIEMPAATPRDLLTTRAKPARGPRRRRAFACERHLDHLDWFLLNGKFFIAVDYERSQISSLAWKDKCAKTHESIA